MYSVYTLVPCKKGSNYLLSQKSLYSEEYAANHFEFYLTENWQGNHYRLNSMTPIPFCRNNIQKLKGMQNPCKKHG